MTIKAILLDLDDTLLINPTEVFARNMIGALDAFLAERAGWQNSHRAMIAALQAAAESRDPSLTNIEVFLAHIDSAWAIPVGEKMKYFMTFYKEVYPRLQQAAQPRAAAPALVRWLIDAGYQVVIATNPIFALEAITQRLAWAGLPAEAAAYTLVTSMENMHFTKPAPHYYEEILARIGVSSHEAIMIGDDWQNDIQPAMQAGLNTFWIADGSAAPLSDGFPPDGRGTLDDFARLVCQENWLETLQPRPALPPMIAPRLLANLAALFGLWRESDLDALRQKPALKEWSALEIVRHLRDADRLVYRPRMEKIIHEDNPLLVDPPGPADDEGALESILESFAVERRVTLDMLEGLPTDAWTRRGYYGPSEPITLLELADSISSHDRFHLRQIRQTGAI